MGAYYASPCHPRESFHPWMADLTNGMQRRQGSLTTVLLHRFIPILVPGLRLLCVFLLTESRPVSATQVRKLRLSKCYRVKRTKDTVAYRRKCVGCFRNRP